MPRGTRLPQRAAGPRGLACSGCEHAPIHCDHGRLRERVHRRWKSKMSADADATAGVAGNPVFASNGIAVHSTPARIAAALKASEAIRKHLPPHVADIVVKSLVANMTPRRRLHFESPLIIEASNVNRLHHLGGGRKTGALGPQPNCPCARRAGRHVRGDASSAPAAKPRKHPDGVARVRFSNE